MLATLHTNSYTPLAAATAAATAAVDRLLTATAFHALSSTASSCSPPLFCQPHHIALS
jgi:hypothetical protein